MEPESEFKYNPNDLMAALRLLRAGTPLELLRYAVELEEMDEAIAALRKLRDEDADE